jgi:hypothetical protein
VTANSSGERRRRNDPEWRYFGTGDQNEEGARHASARREMVAPTGFEPVFQP